MWQRKILIAVLLGLYFLQFAALHFYYRWGRCDYFDGPTEQRLWTLNDAARHSPEGLVSYEKSIYEVRSAIGDSVYRFDKGFRLPLLRQRKLETDKNFRISVARSWLRTQRLVVASVARNAMENLESLVAELNDLSTLFQSVTAVFVENDSVDGTRNFLYNQSKSNTNFTLILLGCETINSPEPCNLNITYRSSGLKHRQGHWEQANRTLEEESIDRGLVMAALRNIYLHFTYSHLSTHDLLLVLESDLSWKKWDMDSVLQGLYYFMAKQVDSLCAFTLLGENVHDPCSLIFYSNRYFYANAEELEAPFLDRIGRPNERFTKHLDYFKSRARDFPQQPVKVASCFQGATFYRLSSLRAASALYGYSEGEWHCEHSTLSRQLRENYLDTQMVFRLTKNQNDSLARKTV